MSFIIFVLSSQYGVFFSPKCRWEHRRRTMSNRRSLSTPNSYLCWKNCSLSASCSSPPISKSPSSLHLHSSDKVSCCLNLQHILLVPFFSPSASLLFLKNHWNRQAFSSSELLVLKMPAPIACLCSLVLYANYNSLDISSLSHCLLQTRNSVAAKIFLNNIQITLKK